MKNTVGKKVRQYRLKKNLTQLAIAQLIEVSVRHYRKLESGERDFLHKHLVTIAEYLEIDMAEFYPPFFNRIRIKKIHPIVNIVSKASSRLGGNFADYAVSVYCNWEGSWWERK